MSDPKILYAGPSPRGGHRLSLAARCMQLFAFAERDAEKPRPHKDPLVIGSLLHLALAQHYRRMKALQEGTPVEEWATPKVAVELIARLERYDRKHVAIVGETYQAYAAARPMKEEIRQFRVLNVEAARSAHISWDGKGPYLFTGRQDLEIEDSEGRVWVWDHKTTARITGSQEVFYGLSAQFLGYGYLARQEYGRRFAGLDVNLIQHTQSGSFKNKWIRFPRSEYAERNFPRFVVDIETRIDAVRTEMQAQGRGLGDWPKARHELVCFPRYGKCPHTHECFYGPADQTADLDIDPAHFPHKHRWKS